MTKSELIDMVAEETGLTKKDTGNIINTTIDTMMYYLGEEAGKAEDDRDNVQIVGFGTFEVRDRAEKRGINPQTGEKLTIPERKIPFFKAGMTFKEKVSR